MHLTPTICALKNVSKWLTGLMCQVSTKPRVSPLADSLFVLALDDETCPKIPATAMSSESPAIRRLFASVIASWAVRRSGGGPLSYTEMEMATSHAPANTATSLQRIACDVHDMAFDFIESARSRRGAEAQIARVEDLADRLRSTEEKHHDQRPAPTDKTVRSARAADPIRGCPSRRRQGAHWARA